MAATAENVIHLDMNQAGTHVSGETPVSVVLFVANTDNPSTQQRALDALNRHSCIARARTVPDATRQIRVDYWAGYTNISEVISTARFHAGVELRQLG